MFPFHIIQNKRLKRIAIFGEYAEKGADPFHVAADPDKDSEAISLAAAQAKKMAQLVEEDLADPREHKVRDSSVTHVFYIEYAAKTYKI